MRQRMRHRRMAGVWTVWEESLVAQHPRSGATSGHLHRAESRLALPRLALGRRAAAAARSAGMALAGDGGGVCAAFIHHGRVAMQRAHDREVGRADHPPRLRGAIGTACRVAAFGNRAEQREFFITGSALKRIDRHGDTSAKGSCDKRARRRAGRAFAGGGQTTTARSVPPTFFVGPSAFGVMSKSKISVGR